MTKPNPERKRDTLVGTIEDLSGTNQRLLIDMFLVAYGDDKSALFEAIRAAANNNNLINRVSGLVRMGRLQEAEDLLIDAKILEKKLLRGKS